MQNKVLSESNWFKFFLVGDFLMKKYSNNHSSEMNIKIEKGISIFIILEGKGIISYDDRNVIYSKDNLIWFNQLYNKTLKIKPVKGHFEFIYFSFCEELIRNNIILTGDENLFSPEYITLRIGKTLKVLILQSLHLPCKGITKELFILGKAMEIISVITYQLCVSNDYFEEKSFRNDRKIKIVKEILMQEYQNPPGLKELSSRIGINTKKLTNKFREQNGKSIYEWLQDYRLQMAYYLICSNFGNISKIASEIGYTTSHFCTVFKKKYGISPGDLKKF